jgi:hypothetical protein
MAIVGKHLRSNPKRTSQDLCDIIEEKAKVEVSVYTMRRRLKERGYKRRTCKKKPNLKAIHSKRRYLLSIERKDWTKQHFRRIVYCDESHFKQFGKIKEYYWAKKNSLAKRSTSATEKFGGI